MRTLWRTAIAVLLTTPAAERSAGAWTSRAALDLLRPGSHAAVGFGGDPFLSPLADETGWWSHLDLGAPPGSRAVLESSQPAELGNGTGFESSSAAWIATTGGQWSRTSWTAGMAVDRPRWNGGWEGSRGGLSLRGSGTAAEAGLRVRPLPELCWQLAGTAATGEESRSRAAIAAGVRYQPSSGSTLQGSWQRVRRPDELRSTLYGERIGVAANLVHESQRLEGRWASWWGTSLEGAVARTRWMPSEATAALGYQVTPAGTSGLDQAGLRWGPGRRQVLLRWTRFALDLQGDLAWGGQSFGGIDYARGTLESWLVAFQRTGSRGRRTLFEVERVRLEGRARGEIESWPFTSTLVDLLGQRRIFRLDGSAGWERWHLAHAHPFAGRAFGRIGAEWIDLRPEGRLESWRPAFLVFGKVDDQVDTWDIRRVRLAVLSLGGSLSTAVADVDLGIEQCVWAHARRHDGTPGTTSGSTPPAPSASRAWDGLGTRARLAISRPF